MVNIRATLQRAEQEGVLSAESRSRIERIAKAQFYPDRNYATLLSEALGQGLALSQVRALEAFVRDHRVDQKRLDAAAMLEAMRACEQEGQSAGQASFDFVHTEAWDQVVEASSH